MPGSELIAGVIHGCAAASCWGLVSRSTFVSGAALAPRLREHVHVA